MTWYRSVRPGCCIRGNAGSAIFNEPHAHIQTGRKHEGFGIISNNIKTFVCLNDKFFGVLLSKKTSVLKIVK